MTGQQFLAQLDARVVRVADRKVFLITTAPRPPAFSLRMKCCMKR